MGGEESGSVCRSECVWMCEREIDMCGRRGAGSTGEREREIERERERERERGKENYWFLLQKSNKRDLYSPKRRIITMSLLIVATPYLDLGDGDSDG